MPPRYAYWTILAGGLPTAFRTTDREELLPTFRQIQRKHPDAEMKYFARGKLWATPEEARAAAEAARARPQRGTGRGRDWRPGGEHRDPRQKFKDAAQARNRQRRTERFDRRTRDEKPRVGVTGEKPHGDPVRRPPPPRRPGTSRPRSSGPRRRS